jgi:hypothetical protein
LNKDVEAINRAKQIATRLGIPLRVYPIHTERNTLVCDADPLNTIYINHKGEVSPCVYLGLTVQGKIPRYYQGEYRPFNPSSFGNVCDGLTHALEGRERREFLEIFKRRNVSSDPFTMFTYLASQQGESELPPPPAPCQFCYKMLGI